MHDTKMYTIKTVGAQCVYPSITFGIHEAHNPFHLCGIWEISVLMFLLADFLSAHSLESLYNHSLPFHFAVGIH